MALGKMSPGIFPVTGAGQGGDGGGVCKGNGQRKTKGGQGKKKDEGKSKTNR